MASSDMNGNVEAGSIEDGDGLQIMKDWLFTEVADDNDIVVDEMQEEFHPYFEEEEAQLGEFKGSNRITGLWQSGILCGSLSQDSCSKK